MTKHELKEAINDFFSDTSRSQAETKDALLDLIDEMRMMADSLEDE